MNSEADPPDPPAGDDTSAAALPRDANERVQELFAREHRLLVSYIIGLRMTRAEAEDIAAQAFAKLLQLKDPASISELRAYLYTAARHIAFNRYKHLAMQERNDPLFQAEQSEDTPSPEPGLIGQQRNELLHHTLEQLPPRCHAAMILRFWQDYSSPEIVEWFRVRGIWINEKTVRRDIIKGVEECRKAILAAEGSTKELRK